MMEEYKDLDHETWDGTKPNDMLMWLMEEAKDEEKEVRSLVLRILTVNFAAIHTSSMSFAHALYRLAADPSYISPLREEVERVLKEENGVWSKYAISKMKKVDSFMKECQRYYGLGVVSMTRKALKDFSFSDGTFIPKGTFVSSASGPIHFDSKNYDHPEVFDPWRFAEADGSSSPDGGNLEGSKLLFVSTSTEYMPFGHGKHACPGRFFAATELKTMLAHLVLNYDIKMEDEGVLPSPIWFNFVTVPNPKIEVLFRKRLS